MSVNGVEHSTVVHRRRIISRLVKPGLSFLRVTQRQRLNQTMIEIKRLSSKTSRRKKLDLRRSLSGDKALGDK